MSNVGRKTRPRGHPGVVPRVTEVSVDGPYLLDLTFADGLRKRVDLKSELHGEVLEPLRDHALFAQVEVDAVSGAVIRPNGADFAPEFLYDWQPRDRSANGYSGANGE